MMRGLDSKFEDGRSKIDISISRSSIFDSLSSILDPRSSNSAAILYLLSSILFLLAGCKSTATSTTASQPQPSKPMAALSPLDPCPERLHDLAGALLNFLV